MMRAGVLMAGLMLVAPVFAWAAGGDPVLTQSQGEVMILSSPQTEPHAQVQAGYTRSKFEGKFYLAKKAVVGDSVPLQAWLRTFPGARARLVYPNGDQVNVGPGSFFRLQGGALQMDYGMVRAIISKSGPRSGFKVRTPSAVMGVRGTDFLVEASGANAPTALTLIRGAVTLQASGVAKPAEVKTGQTAVAEPKKAPEPFATSQIELKRALVLTEKTEKASGAEAEVPESVAQLEAQARATTVTDMVQYASTPEERARLEKLAAQAGNVQELNSSVVKLQIAQAPVTSPRSQAILEEIRKKSKRSDLELKDLEKNPYEKYFDSTQME